MARARRNVASPPPQQAPPPNFEDFVAATGAGELLPPEAAVAAVPVAGALTTAAAAAAVAGVLGAFASFNVKREAALRSYLTDTLVRMYPDRTREEILRFVRDELARDREFVRNQQQRLQKDLVEAMKLDPDKREARVQAVLDRERRYTQMHEQAAIERSAARTSFLNVRDASPQGALWMLGPATTHTPSCVGFAGKFWPWTVLDKVHPQLHAGCVPAGVVVDGPGAQKAMRRWWEGELVDLVFESGRRLSVTPNHPVLTRSGWAAAGEIHEGCDVVGGSTLDGGRGAHDDDDQMPSRIEDVFDARLFDLRSRVLLVPAAPEDFHGDGGWDGEIEVVGTDGLLWHSLDTARSEKRREVEIVLCDMRSMPASAFQRDGSLEASMLRDALPTDGGVSRGGERGALLLAETTHPDALLLARAPKLNSGPSKLTPYGLARVAELLREGFHGCPVVIRAHDLRELALHRGHSSGAALLDPALRKSDVESLGINEALDALVWLAGDVHLDRVIEVRRRPFAGHVYNLDTGRGWYIANGIVVHNCQCYLVGKDEAVERGFMHEDQARVDPKDALARAAEIAKLEDIVMEAASPEEIRAYLDAIQEGTYRLPRGVHGGGEFAKRGETGTPILARHAIEKLLRRLAPQPSTPAERRRDAAGEWKRIGGREVYVPEHRAWERELDGRRLYSPPQSTAVYQRDDYVKKPPVEVPPEKQEQVTQVGQDLKAQWRARAYENAKSALAKQDKNVPPVEVGDHPWATHQGLTQAGFYVAGQKLPEHRGGSVTRMYEHPSTQARVEVTAHKRRVTYVAWHPGRKPQEPKPLLDRPPTSQDEFFDDVFSLAHSLASAYERRPEIQSVRISDVIEDMGGQHTWQGVLELGRDTRAALAALNKAREENRPLTYRESRLVYSLYRAAAHEALHASAPIKPGVFADANDASARGLEEALTEELASIESVNMLRRQGLTDVLRWVKANPTDFKVEGNYSEYRTQLSRILDRANVPPEKREDVIRTLKFSFDPGQRADGLASLVAAEDRVHGMNHEQSRDWVKRIYDRADDRTWRPMSSDHIFTPNVRPDLSDVPDEPPVMAADKPVYPGTRVKLRGRAGLGVVQAILRRDEGPLFDVQYGLSTFQHGVHPEEVQRVGDPPEGIEAHVGEVRIDGQTFRPGDRVSYLGDNGRTEATVDRVIRATNPDMMAAHRGWQIEATTAEGVPVLLDHGRARGLRQEVASDVGYDPGVTGEVMTRATPGGERQQAEPFRKYGEIPEKIKWRSVGPGSYDSADGRLTLYRIEGVRPPAWNVEWTTGYAYEVQGTDHVKGYSSPIYAAIVDGAATMKDAKGFADDEWPRLREVIAGWEAPQRMTPGGEREDYRGSHTAPSREPGTSLDDPTSAFGGDEIYGPNALHYYGSGGPSPQQDPETQAWARRSQQASRESLAAVQAARGNPDHVVTVYRAVPPDSGMAINPGDWVTPSRTYAEIHGESNIGEFDGEWLPKFQVIERKVRAGDLFTDGDLSEWGWQPEIEPYIPSPAWLQAELIPTDWKVEHGYGEWLPNVGFRNTPYRGVPGGMDDKDALRVLHHYFTGSTEGWTGRKKQKDEVLAQAVERWKAANPRWAEQGRVKQ